MDGYTERGTLYTYEIEDYLLVGKRLGTTTQVSPLGIIDVSISRSDHGGGKELLRDIYRCLGSTIGHTPYFRSGYLGFTAIYPRNAPVIDRVVSLESIFGVASIDLRIKCLGSSGGNISLVTGSKSPYKWPHDPTTECPFLHQTVYDEFIDAVRQQKHVTQKKDIILAHFRKDLERHKQPSKAKIARLTRSLQSLGCTPDEIISFFASAAPVELTTAQNPPRGEEK